MRMHLFIAALMFIISTTSPVFAQSKLEVVQAAIASAQKVCLSGTKYHLETNKDGDVELSMPDGKSASMTIDEVSATGSVLFQDDVVKAGVDEQIRNCMVEQWGQVFHAMFDEQTYTVTIAPSGYMIDNSDVGNIYESSTLEFLIDGKSEETMRTRDAMDPIVVQLTKGVHTISFKANMRSDRRLHMKDTCTAKFTVEEASAFHPLLILKQVNDEWMQMTSCEILKTE